eukprot:ctg_269.g174
MSGRVSLAVGFVSPGVPSGRGAHLLHTGQLQVSRTRPRTSFPSKCKRVPGYWRPLRALAERDNGRPPPPSPRAVNATSAATTTAAAAGDGVAVDEADAARRQLAERRFAAVRERVAALEQKVQGLEAERRVMLAGRLLRALEDSAFSKRVTAAVADVMAAEPGEADRSAGGAAGTRSAMDKSGEPAAEMSNQEEWLQGIGRICQQTISVLESALSWTAPPSPQRERLQEMLQRVEAVMEGAQLSEMRALTATPASTTETASSGTRDFFNRAIRALRSRSRTNAVTTDEELESVLASAAQMRRTASLKGDMDRVLGAESEPDKEPNTAKRGAISSPASSGAAPGAEGALEECKRRAAELQRVATQFVSETWQRLNGVPVSGDDHGETAAADGTRGRTAASTGTLMQRQSTILKATMDELKPLERQLQELSKEREARLRREGPLGKLVHIKELRALDDRVNALRRQISVRLLEGEMERIKLTLEAELEAATVLAPLATFNDQEELLLIAEYGLFGKRLAEMQVLVDVGEAALIDDEALAALASDIQDLKARLGMGEDDAYMNLGAMVLDWRRVHQYTAELARKTREGRRFGIHADAARGAHHTTHRPRPAHPGAVQRVVGAAADTRRPRAGVFLHPAILSQFLPEHVHRQAAGDHAAVRGPDATDIHHRGVIVGGGKRGHGWRGRYAAPGQRRRGGAFGQRRGGGRGGEAEGRALHASMSGRACEGGVKNAQGCMSEASASIRTWENTLFAWILSRFPLGLSYIIVLLIHFPLLQSTLLRLGGARVTYCNPNTPSR